MPVKKTSPPPEPVTIPCYICKHPVDTSDESNFEITLEDEKPKYFMHIGCAERAQKVYETPDRSEEIFSLQRRLTDLQMAYSELDMSVKNSADISSILTYLEEFIETQRLSSKRAPQGSMEQRINAFRSNDAESLLQMVRALMPIKSKEIEE